MQRGTRTRMFDVVAETWNPITGCLHDCIYCWARRLALTRLRRTRRYRNGFKPRLNEEEFRKRFKPDRFVFCCDMGDAFGDWVPDEWILRVFRHVMRFTRTRFLFLTKNPHRYYELLEQHGPTVFPRNGVYGATVETLHDDLYYSYRVSAAPAPSRRLLWLKMFVERVEAEADWRPATFVSIEPILFNWSESDIDYVASILEELKPLAVYIGYDNYGIVEKAGIPEPPLGETLRLIEALRSRGITVYEKTIRRAWNELG